MGYEFTNYVIPLLIAAVTSAAVSIYSWTRRSAPGAISLFFMALSLAVWTIFYAFEVSAVGLEAKYFWGVLEYIGIAFAPFTWLTFSLAFSGRGHLLTRRFLRLTAALPLVTVILALTTRWHGLIWSEYHLSRDGEFSALGVAHGPWFWVHFSYSYGLLFVSTVLLVRMLLKRQGVYRGQIVYLLIAVLAPWVGNILYLSGNSPIPHLDLTPFAFTISVVALAWAIFGLHLVDVTPLARDMVVDSLRDGFVVLDARGVVVDLNASAARIFGVESVHSLGMSADQIFAPWFDLVERIRDSAEWRGKITTGTGHAQIEYDVTLSPIVDLQGRFAGRVLIVHQLGVVSRPLRSNQSSGAENEESSSASEKFPSYSLQYPVIGRLMDYFAVSINPNLPVPPNISPAWYQARERSFTLIIRIGALIGTVAYIFTLPILRTTARFTIANFAFGSILVLLWLLGFVRNQSFQVRANLFLFLIYFMAVNETVNYGFSVECFLFFTSFVIITTLLTGRNGVRVSTSISFATLSSFAWFIGSGFFVPLNSTPGLIFPANLAVGFTNVFVFLATSLSMASATVVLMENLNSAWQKETQTLKLLQQERDLLEQRVDERTHDLQEAETKFRTLVEQLPAALYRDDADTNGNNNYYSPQVEKLLGYPMSTWLEDSRHWHKIIHPDDRERALASIDVTMREGYSTTEYRVISSDGRQVWLRDEALLVGGADGSPRFVQGILQDITEMKRAEEQIRKLSRAVEQSGNSIVITNTDGDIEYVNPKFEQVTGFSLEETLGKNPRILKSGMQRPEFYEKMWKTISSGQVWHGVFNNKKKDGSLYWESATIAPVLDQNNSVVNYVAIKEDVTARREADEQLRKLSRAVEQSGNTVLIMDRKGIIEYVNPKFTETTGYAPADAIGRSPVALMRGLSSEPDFSNDEWWITVTGGNIWRGEFQNRRKNGSYFWESASIAPVHNRDGEITNFIEIKQDVTEQKILQDQLQKQNDYLSILHQVTLDLLNRRDQKDLLTNVVNHASVLLDAPFAELMLLEGSELVVQAATENQIEILGERVNRDEARLSWQAVDTRQPIVLEDYSAWSGHRAAYDEFTLHAVADFPVVVGDVCLGVLALGRSQLEYTFTPEQVQTGILFARLAALVLENARLYGSALHEIEERKRYEGLLQESETRFRQIVENASDIIYRTDVKGNFTYANPAALRMMGFAEDKEVLGRNYLDLTTPETRHRLKRTYDHQFMSRTKNTYYEFPAVTADGQLVWVGQNVQLIMDGDQIIGFQALARDITQLRQAQEALSLSRDQALEASRFKSQLVSRVSHELRTPLGGIIGYAELLQYQAFGALNDQQQKAILNIIESAKYLTSTVNDLLDQAQLESGSLSLRNQLFDPFELFKKIESTMSVLAGNKGLSFRSEVSQELPRELFGDENRLQQVITNLAGNAIKFTKNGEVLIRVLRPAADQWSIEVCDTGVGIPPDEQNNIFEPFRQVSNAITRENRGSGLGLAIVHQLVGLMGGYIGLKSEMGKGSTFTVILPISNPLGE